jgi:hypothetical protein
MHVKVELYQPAKESGQPIPFPIEFLNLREFEVKRAVDDMVVYGIGRVVTNYITLGLSSWSDIKFRPLSAAPAQALVSARNKILRLTAERLAMFGILEIALDPSEDDMRTIRAYWAKLSGGQPTAKDKIPLNIELDPMPMRDVDATEVAVSKPLEGEPPPPAPPPPAIIEPPSTQGPDPVQAPMPGPAAGPTA